MTSGATVVAVGAVEGGEGDESAARGEGAATLAVSAADASRVAALGDGAGDRSHAPSTSSNPKRMRTTGSVAEPHAAENAFRLALRSHRSGRTARTARTDRNAQPQPGPRTQEVDQLLALTHTDDGVPLAVGERELDLVVR